MIRNLFGFGVAALLGLAVSGFGASITSQDNAWTSLDAPPAAKLSSQEWIRPAKYHLYQVSSATLLGRLKGAPLDAPGGAARAKAMDIYLPNPEGGYSRFRVVESPVMEPALAAQFPDFKTYSGQGVDDPTATMRCDWTAQGFHASVLTPSGMWYVDPWWKNETVVYSSYYKRDLVEKDPWHCGVESKSETQETTGRAEKAMKIQSSGTSLRTYRLACAADGEYTAYQSSPQASSVTLGLAAVVTAVNRVNQVYEADFAIHMTLVANNASIIYTNGATDPYDNADAGGDMLPENQSNLDSVIGSANYDIGHVVGTGGGGLAEVGVVCIGGQKAMGETGLSNPTGDGFYIDYVAHEMGHQFGGNHTFNDDSNGSCAGNRNPSTAMEPGSGSTIMAYAGICTGDDLQPHSDPYFHSKSYDEIMNYVTTFATCASVTATGNTPPTANAGADYAIPISTPFTLTASGSDINADSLTYCWEERDLGGSGLATDADNGSSPIFRSFSPTSSPSRTFPKLSDIINNTSTIGEKLPTVSHSVMAFRVTVRDNRAGGGGVNTDDMQLQVVGSAGPFQVTFPNAVFSLFGAQTVTWNVANTNLSPINTSQVNILLSTDGGNTFPTTLKSATPNDGSEVVTLPSINTATARIRVEAVGNVYWDMSNVNFTITPPPAAVNDSWALYN